MQIKSAKTKTTVPKPKNPTNDSESRADAKSTCPTSAPVLHPKAFTMPMQVKAKFTLPKTKTMKDSWPQDASVLYWLNLRPENLLREKENVEIQIIGESLFTRRQPQEIKSQGTVEHECQQRWINNNKGESAKWRRIWRESVFNSRGVWEIWRPFPWQVQTCGSAGKRRFQRGLAGHPPRKQKESRHKANPDQQSSWDPSQVNLVRIVLLRKRRRATRIIRKPHRNQQHLQTLLPRNQDYWHLAVLRSLWWVFGVVPIRAQGRDRQWRA